MGAKRPELAALVWICVVLLLVVFCGGIRPATGNLVGSRSVVRQGVGKASCTRMPGQSWKPATTRYHDRNNRAASIVAGAAGFDLGALFADAFGGGGGASAGIKNKVASTKQELLESLAGLDEGAKQTPEQKERVLALVDQLKDLMPAEGVTAKKGFNSRWKLLWTTEKETLTFRKSGFFGKKYVAAYQDIDVVEGRLQNLIDFDDGYFSVMSTLSVDEDNLNRCNFKFTSAGAKYGQFGPITLPPFGKGWFETVYMDDDLRIAEDIRGDTLICQKSDEGTPFAPE